MAGTHHYNPSTVKYLCVGKTTCTASLDLTIKQREEVYEGWDKPKMEIMERFFVHHPEWRDTTTIEGRFAWRWYYAFRHFGD